MQELLNLLNERVADLSDTRINDYTQFHYDIKDRTCDLLEQYRFHIKSCWNVWTTDTMDKVEGFSYTIPNFRVDKGQKSYNRKGRIEHVEFTAIGGTDVPIDVWMMARKLEQTITRQAELEESLSEKEARMSEIRKERENCIGLKNHLEREIAARISSKREQSDIAAPTDLTNV